LKGSVADLLQPCDTPTPDFLALSMLESFAEFERSMVRERTRAGLFAARDRGVKVGRPAKLSRHQQQEIIRTVRDGSKTAADAARLFGTAPVKYYPLAGTRERAISLRRHSYSRKSSSASAVVWSGSA
jgi:DNA invertase Pin-like site-specific DNA recombinase